MYYPEDLVEEIRATNDIVDVISSFVKLDRKGASHFGLCPFHNEKSPSFSVSRNKQMYYCFGCGVGGNVYTFIMSYENFTFIEAVKYLADRSNIKLPEVEYSKEARERADLKATLFEINKEAAKYFYFQLRNNQGKYAYDYLRQRNISDETIVNFGLGYSNQYSDDLYKHLRNLNYSEDLIRQAGLIQADEKQGNYDRFWNRVMFPIMDHSSKVIGFGGRVMGEGKPKYLNSPETPIFDKSKNLYGINRARTSRKSYFLVCEGYFDVIALYQKGYTNSVATLGTALTYGHANLIKRYVDEVYLTYDNDEAGVKAATRSIPILTEAGLIARVIDLQPYKDPDDFMNNLGIEEFEKRIQNAKNGFMYGLEVLGREFRLDTPEDKTRFFNEVASRLLNFEEEIERNNYIEAVANHYRISRDSLQSLVTKMAVRQGLAKPAAPVKQGHKDYEKIKDPKMEGLIKAQKTLLTMMIDDVTIFEKSKEYINFEDFTNELYQTVVKLLHQQMETNQLNPSAILNHFADEEAHKEVAALFHANLRDIESEEEKERALKEILIKIKSGSLERRTKESSTENLVEWQKISMEKRKLEELMKKEKL